LLTYRIALSYAEKGIDQSLTQSVRALARQVKPVGSGLLIDFPRAAQDVLEQDPDDRISYMVSSPPGQFLLGNQRLPQPVGEGLAGHRRAAAVWRPAGRQTAAHVVAMDVRYGEGATPQTCVCRWARALAERQRIARELVADMLAPLLALGCC
jgi:two-component system, OmpR family, sensor histidine kinase TctE